MQTDKLNQIISKENELESNMDNQTKPPTEITVKSKSTSNNKLNYSNKKSGNNLFVIKEGVSQSQPEQYSKDSGLKSGASSDNSKRRLSTVKREKITIHFGIRNANIQSKLPDNTITSTKYSIISFFPKSLFFQFKRAANIYFLIVSILTCTNFSPKKPSSMIGTFAFVLIATMLKELYEDYNRYKQDKQSNSRIVHKLNTDGWNLVKCSTLRPGEIVKINKEEEFSADCLIIQSSNETGYCYIDTKNLDGETNLKEKTSIEEYKDIEDLQNFNGSMKCEKSNANLHVFEGVISNAESNNRTVFVNIRNVILKGCTLKNTEYVIGIVVYSGKNTKIMKNSKTPRIKTSNILRIMNYLLYSLFAFTIVLCIILSGLSLKFKNDSGVKREYVFNDNLNNWSGKSDGLYYCIRVIIFFVAYSNIIPISLYVALEMVKIFQGLLIFYDNDLYDNEIEKAAKCRATDLIEELGQVEFIFSDKTGTLTQNSMILKQCFIGSNLYGVSEEIEESEQAGNSIKRSKSYVSHMSQTSIKLNRSKEQAKFTINGDKSAYDLLKSQESNDDDKEKINNFFTNLSLCHSVFPETTDKGIDYQGSSPDDIALVKGAAQFGYTFDSKDFNKITIKNEIHNTFSQYEILVEMPFDSDRKRMSVIVKNLENDKIIIYSKGADTVMNSRINWSLSNEDDNKTAFEIMDILCKQGFRCLVFAEKELSLKDYNRWYNLYSSSQAKGRDVTKHFEEIEQNLVFSGISAIEDKLQEGVGATIHSLLSCNIRVWVLTGDKEDTAVEIAKSCKLIQDNTFITKIIDPENVEQNIIDLVMKYQLDTEEFLGIDFIHKARAEEFDESQVKKSDIIKFKDLNKLKDHVKRINMNVDSALIIDGFCLEVVLSSVFLSTAFFYLASASMSVVCCRVSPQQKSKVVKLAKIHGEWITLSIGDGANDVPMIMEAHIGIGIQGKEGTQAVRSSDFSIGQFRFLEKLLLDHGRNSYTKISKFICYYFYKNILLSITELWFSLNNGFSGQIFFADYLNTMYNAFFTSWPCLFTFMFEREHPINIARKFPGLYKLGQTNTYFNLKVFWSYVLYAILHSVFCFFIPFLTLSSIGIINEEGVTYNLWYISTISFSILINVVTFKLLIISEFWNIINIIGTLGSLVFYYVCLFILSNNYFSLNFQPELIGIPYNIIYHKKALIVLFISPIFILCPDLFMKQIFDNCLPDASKYLKIMMTNIEMKRILAEQNSSVTLKKQEEIVKSKLLKALTIRSKKSKNRSNTNVFQSKIANNNQNSNAECENGSIEDYEKNQNNNKINILLESPNNNSFSLRNKKMVNFSKLSENSVALRSDKTPSPKKGLSTFGILTNKSSNNEVIKENIQNKINNDNRIEEDNILSSSYDSNINKVNDNIIHPNQLNIEKINSNRYENDEEKDLDAFESSNKSDVNLMNTKSKGLFGNQITLK